MAIPYRLPVLFALALSCQATAATEHAHAEHREVAIPVPAPRVDIAVEPALLSGLPRHDVNLQVHGTSLQCSGVALAEVLRRAGAMPAEPLRGAHLARRVEAQARDGYRVTFSLGELDPTLGNQPVFLVDRCNGQPLDEHDGPFRLVLPQDGRPARSIRQLQSLTVL
ncbi:hypothetical protein [Pseudoxanthomonas putridarboris]|uniref:Oxidoreductase molybdopterin binding domain-containing protein n=1 Tax=Pseudoxanthomonas putridarboris TaxID=752605 RepID=A0ABU9J425_9GAMM